VGTAQRFIEERVEIGTAFANARFRSVEEFHSTRDEYNMWDDYNEEWMRRNVGEKIATEYAMHQVMYVSPDSVDQEIKWFVRRVNGKIATLRSIRERLPLWADQTSMAAVPANVAEGDRSSWCTGRTSRAQSRWPGSSSAPPGATR
jgi:hypothetical protein